MKATMKATMKDVAEEAGVSIATVSRFVNNTGNISKSLEKKIQRVIEKLDFIPNSTARSLVTHKTNIIGIIVPNITQQYSSNIIDGVNDILYKANYSMILCNIFNSNIDELKYLNILKQKQVDGIIILHEENNSIIEDFINSCNIPIILCGYISKHLKLPYISIDDYKASFDATEYLIKRGNKKISFVGVENYDFIAGKNRFDGFKDAMRKYRLEINEQIIEMGDFTVESGYKAMERILEKTSDFTAVFAVTDEMAVGVCGCLMDKGYKIPSDISVMGFDGIELSNVFRPKISTIKQPIIEMGKESARLLIDMINGKPVKMDNIFDYQLTINESTK